MLRSWPHICWLLNHLKTSVTVVTLYASLHAPNHIHEFRLHKRQLCSVDLSKVVTYVSLHLNLWTEHWLCTPTRSTQISIPLGHCLLTSLLSFGWSNAMDQSPFEETDNSSDKKCPTFMEPRDSLQHRNSPQLDTILTHKNPVHILTPIFFISFNNILTTLRFPLSSRCAFLIWPMRTTRPTHHIQLYRYYYYYCWP